MNAQPNDPNNAHPLRVVVLRCAPPKQTSATDLLNSNARSPYGKGNRNNNEHDDGSGGTVLSCRVVHNESATAPTTAGERGHGHPLYPKTTLRVQPPVNCKASFNSSSSGNRTRDDGPQQQELYSFHVDAAYGIHDSEDEQHGEKKKEEEKEENRHYHHPAEQDNCRDSVAPCDDDANGDEEDMMRDDDHEQKSSRLQQHQHNYTNHQRAIDDQWLLFRKEVVPLLDSCLAALSQSTLPQSPTLSAAPHQVGVISYGPTGSGKTKTVLGSRCTTSSDAQCNSSCFATTATATAVNNSEPKNHEGAVAAATSDPHEDNGGRGGLILQAIRYLWQERETRRTTTTTCATTSTRSSFFSISASYILLRRNAKVFDIFNGGDEDPLKQRVHYSPSIEGTVPDARWIDLSTYATPEEFFDYLVVQRRCASPSSQSSCILTLRLMMEDQQQVTLKEDDEADANKGEHVRPSSFISFFELAGSERRTRTGGEGHVNLSSIESLTPLCAVVDALRKRKPHIPYRSSKLTVLLRPLLEVVASRVQRKSLLRSSATTSDATTGEEEAEKEEAKEMTTTTTAGPPLPPNRLVLVAHVRSSNSSNNTGGDNPPPDGETLLSTLRFAKAFREMM